MFEYNFLLLSFSTGCSVWDVLLFLLAICGVFLVIRPSFIFRTTSNAEVSQKTQIFGSLLACAGALLAAITFTIMRKIGKTIHYLTQVFYFTIFALTLTSTLTSALQWWSPPNCRQDRLLLLAIGVLDCFGQLFKTRAFQIEKAGYVSVMRTNDVTIAFILQFVILNTKPVWTSILGALLIILSSVAINIRKWISMKDLNSHQSSSNHGNSGDDNKHEEKLNNDSDYNDDKLHEA